MNKAFFPTEENPLICGSNLRTHMGIIKRTLENKANLQDFLNFTDSLSTAFVIRPDVLTKAQLAEKSEEAEPGWIYLVSDDENHAYVFLGKEKAGQNGVDENGFYDLGFHIDLSSYATNASVENVRSSVGELQTTLESVPSTYATKDEIGDMLTKTEAGTTYATAADLTLLTSRVATLETNVTGAAAALEALI